MEPYGDFRYFSLKLINERYNIEYVYTKYMRLIMSTNEVLYHRYPFVHVYSCKHIVLTRISDTLYGSALEEGLLSSK